MSDKPFRVVPLDHTYDRNRFDSGSEPLDRYFRERVTQDTRRRVTACFIALSVNGRVAGYYTLASASILLRDLPTEIIKKLPRYPSVTAVRMGRLAVDQAFKGRGLGAALLADALTRVVRSEIAAYALVVDAKDEQAADFYRHHGFLSTTTEPLTLFLPLATAPIAGREKGKMER
ncbi:MAG: GNAT family N-acetyltransferase [Syntrophorhabdales bacterium]|jgi:ribosomal protein S18 acetylase RimI-like enzyme